MVNISSPLTSLMVSVDVKHHVYLLCFGQYLRVQELCESRGDRLGLPVLMSLMVSGRKQTLNHAHALVTVCP